MLRNWIVCLVLIGIYASIVHGSTNYCLDIERKWVLEGEVYTPVGEDYCTKCTCNQGKGDMCMAELCRPPPHCKRYEKVPKTCCKFKCKVKIKPSTSIRRKPVPNEYVNNKVPETYVKLRHDTNCYDFKRRFVKNGETFAPKKHDPCMRCTCSNGKPTLCMSALCQLPKNCTNYEIISEECCKFNCLDNVETNSINSKENKGPGQELPSSNRHFCADWRGRSVKNGDLYQKTNDPCLVCTCQKLEENCRRKRCQPPKNCKIYPRLQSVCCKFKCLDNEENNSLDTAPRGTGPENYLKISKASLYCTDQGGTRIKEGETFVPNKNNFCMKCSCVKGRPRLCMSVQCQTPKNCTSYVRVPGTCCKFICKDQENEAPQTAVGKLGCRDANGHLVREGQTVISPNHNSCVRCRCIKNKLQRCIRIPCEPPSHCEHYEKVNGGCCHYKCKDNQESNYVTNKLIRGPVPESQIRVNLSEILLCSDSSGRQFSEGSLYVPNHLKPCVRCSCKDGQPDSCFQMRCHDYPKNCTRLSKIPGTCCKFTCLDKEHLFVSTTPRPILKLNTSMKNCQDKTKMIALHGKTFAHLRHGRCFTCVCKNGVPTSCKVHGKCTAPTNCKNYKKIPGKCCKFECEDKEQNSTLESKNYCMNSSGQMIKFGQVLKLPGDDKCSECFCVGRNQRLCRAIDCSTLSNCSNKLPDADSCCGFTCQGVESSSNPATIQRENSKSEILQTTEQYITFSTGNQFIRSPNDFKESFFTTEKPHGDVKILQPRSTFPSHENLNFSDSGTEASMRFTEASEFTSSAKEDVPTDPNQSIKMPNNFKESISTTETIQLYTNATILQPKATTLQHKISNLSVVGSQTTMAVLESTPSVKEDTFTNTTSQEINVQDAIGSKNMSNFAATVSGEPVRKEEFKMNVSDDVKEPAEMEREISLGASNQTSSKKVEPISNVEAEFGFLKAIESMGNAVRSLGNSSLPYKNAFLEGFKRSVANAKILIEDIVLKRNEASTTPYPTTLQNDSKIAAIEDNARLDENYESSNLSKYGQMSTKTHENDSLVSFGDSETMINDIGYPLRINSSGNNESAVSESRLRESTTKETVGGYSQNFLSNLSDLKMAIPTESSNSYSSDVVNGNNFEKDEVPDRKGDYALNTTLKSLLMNTSKDLAEMKPRNGSRVVIDLLRKVKQRVQFMAHSSQRFKNVSLKFQNITSDLQQEIRRINEKVAQVAKDRSNATKLAASVMEATRLLKNVSLNLENHLIHVKNLSKPGQKAKTFIIQVIETVREEISNITEKKKLETSCLDHNGKLADEGRYFVKKLNSCLYCKCSSNLAQNCSYGICSSEEKCKGYAKKNEDDHCCKLLCLRKISVAGHKESSSTNARTKNYILIFASVLALNWYF